MTQPYYAGLPSYMGGKRTLFPKIQQAITNIVPLPDLHQASVLDAFAGGGSVSLAFKLLGIKHLHSNDISHRSQCVLQGLIANNHTKLTLESLQDLANLEKGQGTGFVVSSYGGSVFSQRHAAMLDRLREVIENTHCPTTQAMQRILLWKLVSRYVAYGTSIGTSNRGCAEALDSGNYHKLNPNRLRDGSFQRLLKPTLVDLESLVGQINGSVFPAAGSVTTSQQDVLTLLPTITPDIAYFDPPYADTVGYGDELAVLDAVLFGEGITTPNSTFTADVNALSTMLDVAKHIPLWVLSYNDKVVSLDELMALVKAVDPTRTVTGQAIEYAHMAHVAKRTNHELLITAHKGV
jgi:16S rRNA G966 N2-methylase RsmD